MKQAGRQWYIKLDSVLRKFGLQPLVSDPCICFYKDSNNIIIILVYVDDLLITSQNMNKINFIKSSLMKEFETKDLTAKYILGIYYKKK